MAKTTKKQENMVVTRAEKKDATKNVIKELLAVKPYKHNELIDETAKIYTERFAGEDTENINDVKGRVGSVIDIMKKDSEIGYDGGRYALKARLVEIPDQKTEQEKPVKKTRAKSKKQAEEPVKTEENQEKTEKEEIPVKKTAKKSVKKEKAEEKPTEEKAKKAVKAKTSKTAKKQEKTEEKQDEAMPLPPAPLQPIAPVVPVTPEVAPEPIPEDETKEKLAKKVTRARTKKAETKPEVKTETKVEEKPLEKTETATVENKAEAQEKPVEEKEKTEIKNPPIVKEKAEIAKKTEVMDMSFLFGAKPVQKQEKTEEKPVQKTAVKAEIKAEEKPEIKVEAKAEEKPALKVIKTDEKRVKKVVQTLRKADKKPQSADERLQEAFLRKLRSLGGDYFEYYSVYLLERYSMKNGRRLEGMKISGGEKDGGIDGEIELTDKFGFRETIYIQSKNWNPDKGDERFWVVGETLLQQFIGACACRQAQDRKQHCRGIFITTSRFTPDAKRILESMSDKIVGYDGEDLYEAAKECQFGVIYENGNWKLDEKLLSGTKAFFNML